MKIIYDLGSNNGDDIPYYLLKADKVVAVEANPLLVEEIERKFSTPIAQGRLAVECCVITASDQIGKVPFFIHRGHHVLSQSVEPSSEERDNFDQVLLSSRAIGDIIQEHGEPYYVKIDVEGYDQQILQEIFRVGIFPPYLSAESHNIEVFATLVASGRYKLFNIVDGASVCDEYVNHPVATETGTVLYSFPDHSAGPFGGDLKGKWESPNEFFYRLARMGLGWKDIHVSLVDIPALHLV